MELRYGVKTTPDLFTGRIEQKVFSEFQGVRETLWREILDTKEQHVREALIRLGWTPPPETT